jgi:hypothetical protein
MHEHEKNRFGHCTDSDGEVLENTADSESDPRVYTRDFCVEFTRQLLYRAIFFRRL